MRRFRAIMRSGVIGLMLCGVIIGCSAGDDPDIVTTTAGSREMAEYLTRLESYGWSGTVLVAHGDQTLLRGAWGEALPHKGIANHLNTAFSTGSVTKQFTAAAIMKLASDGRLSVQDSLGAFFDDVPEDKAGITIHHLLTHASGLVPGLGSDDTQLSRDSLVSWAMDEPLEAAPGERYEYSNLGYSLLAAIVEVVSGTTYEAFLQNKLFSPAGLVSTGLDSLNLPDTLIAHSANERLGYPSPADRSGEHRHLVGNGGIISTIDDMHRWYRSLHDGTLFDSDTRNRLFTPYIREYEDGESFYGYGWVIDKYGDGRDLIWHNGGAMPHGWSCAVYDFVDDSLLIVAFSNKTIEGRLPVDAVVMNLSRIARNEEYVMPPALDQYAGEIDATFSGDYVSDEHGLLRVAVGDGRLVVQPWGQEAVAVLYPSPFADRLPKYNGWMVELVSALGNGEVDGALPYFNTDFAPADRWRAMASAWWQSFDSLGAFSRIVPQGAVVMGGVHTYGRIEFATGAVLCEFFWDGGKCGGMQGDARPLEKKLVSVTPNTFTSYSLYQPDQVSLSFADSGELTVKLGESSVVFKPVVQ